jgi:thiol-disulfide isomerase/thioredoxin
MKNIILFSAITALLSCSSSHKLSKIKYEIVPDTKAKILKGIVNRQLIENDTSFAWFKENMKWGNADTSAVASFRQKADQFKMVVFGGTWCEDTQNLLPVFYRLIDKSGYPEKNITLIGVDRTKQTIYNLNKTYNIINVPTFIVLKNGKEVGRVVEYGKYNAIDKELGEIVKRME